MQESPSDLPREKDVAAAAGRIRGLARRTPVETSRTLDERLSSSLFLKCENLQRAGVILSGGNVDLGFALELFARQRS